MSWTLTTPKRLGGLFGGGDKKLRTPEGLDVAVDRLVEEEAAYCPRCSRDLAENKLPIYCDRCGKMRDQAWWESIIRRAGNLSRIYQE